MRQLTTEEFIEKAKKIHGDRYDYSLVKYNGSKDKVDIICLKHGIFHQRPGNHLSSYQCDKCGLEKRAQLRKDSLTSFIKKANLVHSGTYNYSHCEYTDTYTPVAILCKTHGKFLQTPNNHLQGKGCPKCGRDSCGILLRLDTETFIKKAEEVHGKSTYSYTKTKYIKGKEKVIITCQKHGDFLQKPNNHLTGYGCKACASIGRSKLEEEVLLFLVGLGVQVTTNSKEIIPPLELDIVLPDYKLAIEVNGLYWHSNQKGKNKEYHLNKTISANKVGYTLIHLFEDDWMLKKEVVKRYLSNLLMQRHEMVGVKYSVVSPLEAKSFHLVTSLQEYDNYPFSIGIRDTTKLLACMSFTEIKNREVELIQYSENTPLLDGFKNLLKYYLEIATISKITSYSNKCWPEEVNYLEFGFTKTEEIPPRKYYIIREKGFSLKQLSEAEDLSSTYIFDCGLDKWEYVVK
jgi:hypothetical protein